MITFGWEFEWEKEGLARLSPVSLLKQALDDWHHPDNGSQAQAVWDGSLQHGAELRTPWGDPAWWSSPQGLGRLGQLFDTLQSRRFFVAPGHCGAHLHLGSATDWQSPEDQGVLERVVRTAPRWLPQIHQPALSRQEGYCTRVHPLTEAEWHTMVSILRKAPRAAVAWDQLNPYGENPEGNGEWGEWYPEGRYSQINCFSLAAHNTIEIRWFTSTLAIEEVQQWMNQVYQHTCLETAAMSAR